MSAPQITLERWCVRYHPSKAVVQALDDFMIGIFYYHFILLLIVY